MTGRNTPFIYVKNPGATFCVPLRRITFFLSLSGSRGAQTDQSCSGHVISIPSPSANRRGLSLCLVIGLDLTIGWLAFLCNAKFEWNTWIKTLLLLRCSFVACNCFKYHHNWRACVILMMTSASSIELFLKLSKTSKPIDLLINNINKLNENR